MLKHISKDMWLDTTGRGTLRRLKLDHSKHLLWRSPYSGSPAINAKLYNEYKDYFDEIQVETNKTTFWCKKSIFEQNKKEIMNGKEKQYAVDKNIWWEELIKQEPMIQLTLVKVIQLDNVTQIRYTDYMSYWRTGREKQRSQIWRNNLPFSGDKL